MKTLDILVCARANLSDPRRWCKGAMARSLDSAEEIDDVFDERVGQRCMMGETLHVAHSYPQSMVADQLLKRAAYPNATDEWLRELDLADFNDSEDTTHEMMLAAFDRAIETEKTRTA